MWSYCREQQAMKNQGEINVPSVIGKTISTSYLLAFNTVMLAGWSWIFIHSLTYGFSHLSDPFSNAHDNVG